MTVAGGCAGGPRPGAVTPAEIPELQTQAQHQPQNAAVRFRLAAALAAASRCDTAVVVARAAQTLAPDNVLGPLVVGTCQEQAGRYDLAIATYTEFANRHPNARGVPALRGKAQLALRASADQTARRALAREAELTTQPPEPATLAVLPIVISGDSSYRPLERGLAELITSDLAIIRSLRLLERLQIGVLLDELKLAESQRVDPRTAARVGHLLRAERMVQGLATIPKGGPVAMFASVVTPQGTVQPIGQVTGPFKALLDLEKQLVINLSAQLGIQLTEAERQRILKQGTHNLTAFLAYSQGLAALDRGDYAAAARHFGDAVRADPGFQAAQQAQQAAQAAPAVQQAAAPGQIVTVVQAVEQVTTPTEPTSSALGSTSQEVAPTLGDVVAQATGGTTTTGTTTTERQTTTENRGVSSVISASGIIHILFKKP